MACCAFPPPPDKAATEESLLVPSAAARHVYRPDVDGLRTVAVVAVIVYHVDPQWLPGGSFGVDVFFVISGYVIAGSLLGGGLHPTMGDYISAFYARRLRRLIPALCLMVAVTALLTAMLIPPLSTVAETHRSFVEPETDHLLEYYSAGALALVGFANVLFSMSKGGSYFDRGPESLEHNPFTHCWSLGVEEQFYLIFPLLVVLLHGKRVVASAPHLPDRWVSCAATVGVIAASVAFCAAIASNQKLAFYLMPSRGWQLASGSLLYELESAGVLRPKSAAAASRLWAIQQALGLAAAALLGVGLGYVSSDVGEGVPLPQSLLAIAGALAYIIAGMPLGSKPPAPSRLAAPLRAFHSWPSLPLPNALLSLTVPVYIGKISYPLYLWHWPIFVVCRWLGWTTGAPDTWKYILPATAFFVAAAVASYHFVETPVRLWRPKKRYLVFVVLLPVIAAIEGLILLLRQPQLGGAFCINKPIVEREPVVPFSISYAPASATESVYGRAASAGLRCACRFADGERPMHMPPNVTTAAEAPLCMPATIKSIDGTRMDQLRVYNRALYDAGSTSRDPDVATVYEAMNRSSIGPLRTIFFLGDSHAAAVAEGLIAATQWAGQVAGVSLFGSCGFRDMSEIEGWDDAKEAAFRAKYEGTMWRSACVKFIKAALEGLRRNVRSGDVVVLVQRASSLNLINYNRDFIENIVRNITAPRGAKILLLGDWPSHELQTDASGGPCQLNVPDLCLPSLLRPTPPACCFVEESTLLHDQKANEGYAALAARHPADIFFYDLQPFFCNPAEANCGYYIPGTQILGYEDFEHISVVGSAYLWPHLCSYFEGQGLI